MPLKPRPGEDLLHFSRRNNARQQDLLDHPDNAPLFAQRDPSALHEDDEIHVPDEIEPVQVDSGRSHVVVYAPPERELRVELCDHDGYPLSADFTLQEIEYDETAQGDEPTELHGYAHEGQVRMSLPASALRATLTVDQDPTIQLQLEFGRLDPITTRTGLLARLHALGYYAGPFDEFAGDAMGAVRLFQLDHGLPATAHADAATLSRLAQRCGDPESAVPALG